MPLFFYSARNQNGQLVRGTIDAISTQAARDALKEQELVPEELHEATLDEMKQESKQIEDSSPPPVQRNYYPFVDTLRLYAGWLLAWYVLVYVLGGYQYTKNVFIDVPYVEALLPPFSDIVFSFTIGSFLFLLLTAIHKGLGRGRIRGWGLTLLGIAVFSLYKLNV